jgi:hypothetical protein
LGLKFGFRVFFPFLFFCESGPIGGRLRGKEDATHTPTRRTRRRTIYSRSASAYEDALCKEQPSEDEFCNGVGGATAENPEKKTDNRNSQYKNPTPSVVSGIPSRLQLTQTHVAIRPAFSPGFPSAFSLSLFLPKGTASPVRSLDRQHPAVCCWHRRLCSQSKVVGFSSVYLMGYFVEYMGGVI